MKTSQFSLSTLLAISGFAMGSLAVELIAGSCTDMTPDLCYKSQLCGEPQGTCTNGDGASEKVLQNYARQTCAGNKKHQNFQCFPDKDNKVPCYKRQLYAAINCPDDKKAGQPSDHKEPTVCAGSTACGSVI